MLGYINGKIVESSDGSLLVGVGSPEHGVVGYSIHVPQGASYFGLLSGEPITLHIYTHVREDALELFGFHSSLEKDVFLALLQVSGVGPKAALGVLSIGGPEEIISAVLDGNKGFIMQAPGVGKRTAERVILDIKDKMKKMAQSVQMQNGLSKSGLGREKKTGLGSGAVSAQFTMIQDVKEALKGLGYREGDIEVVLHQIAQKSEADGFPSRTEDLIRAALKELG
jgi:holliday junction DNA helicase RuvA